MSTDTPVPALVDLRRPLSAEESPVDSAKVLTGAPVQRISNHYSDAGAKFHCGVWSSTAGRWRVRYTEHEFCHLIEGRVRLTSVDGGTWEFGPGDAWVIPAGFDGPWETLEPARKHYAIHEAGE